MTSLERHKTSAYLGYQHYLGYQQALLIVVVCELCDGVDLRTGAAPRHAASAAALRRVEVGRRGGELLQRVQVVVGLLRHRHRGAARPGPRAKDLKLYYRGKNLMFKCACVCLCAWCRACKVSTSDRLLVSAFISSTFALESAGKFIQSQS